jgi:hypothetical protein
LIRVSGSAIVDAAEIEDAIQEFSEVLMVHRKEDLEAN